MDKKKFCMTLHENKDIKAGDIVVVQLPHEEQDREFKVVRLDAELRNLPIIEYQGKELVINTTMIKRKITGN